MPRAVATTIPPPRPMPEAFRAHARRELERRFATPLAPLRLRGFPRAFDVASEDATLLGVVLPPSRRSARGLTSAERAELSEAVLLLTLAPAQQRVLVVPHDRERLLPWLVVYGHLARDVELWQLSMGGELSRIVY